MKKTIFILYALAGYFIFSFPILAMDKHEDEEHYAHVRQQTIGNLDVVPFIFEFLATPDLVSVRRVCQLWNSGVFSTHLLERQKGRVLSFLRGRTYGESVISLVPKISITDPNSTISLSLLNDIWTDHGDLFPIDIGAAAYGCAKSRVEYSIGFLCGSDIWKRHNSIRGTAREDFIIENFNETKIPNIEVIMFLNELLKKSAVNFIFLNGTYFRPLIRMTEEEAAILGEGVGCSSLKSVQLKKIYFVEHPKSLPAFLNHAAKNTKLKCVNLCDVGYELDETIIDTLIQEMPNGLPFELKLPQRLVFNNNGNAGTLHQLRTRTHQLEDRNVVLQNKLTQHFGENIKFVEK